MTQPIDTTRQIGSSLVSGDGRTSFANSMSVSTSDISYSFVKGRKVLDGINLEVPAGEFWTLLGSSGSGKTTLLRLLAGLVSPATGRILFGGRDVTKLDPQRREIGFVFQNYALFPHLNVARNLEFPLKLRKFPKAERDRLITEALDLVHLSDYRSAFPAQLSGGQQQRVAVARALIFRPSIMLLDEPLGALDKRLRQQLGANLREIQQATGITAIYVTHDQEEAFSLSDGVAVMNQGRIEQVDTPVTLYKAPGSKFVAQFLGETNLWSGIVRSHSGSAVSVDIGEGTVLCSANRSHTVGEAVRVSIRPEDITLSANADVANAPGSFRAMGTVLRETFLGSRKVVTAALADRQVIVELPSNVRVPSGGSPCVITIGPGAAVVVA